MKLPFAQKRKIQLIQGAARRGIKPFVLQTFLCAVDSCIRQRHLVFRISAEEIRNMHFYPPSGVSFREVTVWADLSTSAQRMLIDPWKHIDWGEESWFHKGWRLWTAEQEGQLVALCWWRSAAQSRDFFCPLSQESEVLWHVTVIPEFQGNGMHIPLWLSLMRERVTDGVADFYTNCRDYNTPSRRNIERMGFSLIGYATDSRWTGRRKWHSLAAEECESQ